MTFRISSPRFPLAPWAAIALASATAGWVGAAHARPAPRGGTEEAAEGPPAAEAAEGGAAPSEAPAASSEPGRAGGEAAGEGGPSGSAEGSEKPAEQGAAAKPKRPPPRPAPGPSDAKAAPADAEAAAAADAEAEPSLQEQVVIHLGSFTLSPLVLVGLQVVPYVGDEALVGAGDVAEQAGFRLRHARFGMRGRYEDQAELAISTEITADGESAAARIRDAWVSYTPWPFLGAYVGARAVPFSRSALVGSGNGALAERPLAVRAMAPFHQVGAQLDGEIAEGAFGYTVGLTNGLQRSDQFYAGYEENYSPIGNRFDGLAYAFRLRSEPLGRLGPTMADEDHGPVRFGVGASYFYSDGGARDLHSAEGDALLHVEGFHLLAEALWNLSVPQEEPTQPTVAIEQIAAFAIVAETGYMILRDALGITARFEWIDPNTNTENEGDNWLITAGAGYQFFDRLLKVQAEYTHREEVAGLPLANDAVLLQFQLQLSALQGAEDSP